MKVALQEIIGTELVRRVVDDGWFPAEELEIAGPLDSVAVIRRTGSDRVQVTGSLQVEIAANCDRCCRAVRVPLATEFVYNCMVGRDPGEDDRETECRDEDSLMLYLRDPVVDLGALFREQVYLALPARILCCQNCQGLCQHCGSDLNEGSCSCQQPEAAGPFAALRQLKTKKS